MEYLKKDPILQFNQDTLEAVRKIHGLSENGRIKEAIDLLESWAKKQNHFVKKEFNREYLERLLITTKGSVERAKVRLDKICTMRTLMPEFFQDYDIRKDFENMLSITNYAVLPQLTKDHDRVCIVQNRGKHYSPNIFHNGFIYFAMLAEYLRAHDYADSYILIPDLREVNITDIATNIDLVDMHKSANLLMEGYGMRIKGLHLLTSSKLIDTLISIMKQVLSPKIGGRIHVHRTVESLYEFVPKSVLPIEYGGEERSIIQIKDEWIDIMSSKAFREYRSEMKKASTDELLRHIDKFNDQYMGMPGSFRTLVVD